MIHGAKGRLCLLAAAVLVAALPVQGAVKIDSNTFGGLEAREIGPAVMGGRIAALDAVYVDDRLTIYVGAASGGLWKSSNGGTTFKPVFDEYTQSIGAVAIDRADPDTVWVGTGEAWTRNSISVGTGVYKTTDGGDTWTHLGLEDSERIVELLVHPADSETVYACVTGHLWDANEQRGVYKTGDGGKTWERILYVDADTGCSDLAMDPQESQILYAAMWEFRRSPDFFNSGGPGSGLHKSEDGGKTWRKLTRGLPEGELGRIAIGVAPSRPNVIYATVESKNTGMYRSDDLGESWRWVGTTSNVEARPFYFSLLIVDLKDHNRVYKPASGLSVSTDGGKTFDGLAGGTHADHHAFWIDPRNVHHLLLGTDGGLYESLDRGVTWTFRQNLPISQFYHVSYDMEMPYNVYGGLQDNGTWYGPTATPSGVQNKHWRNIGSGDGFYALVDRAEPDIVYLEWQGGRAQRVRRSTGELKDIQPLPEEGDPEYRFNWNAAMHLSPTRDDTLYIGGQFLFRTRDRGDSWEKISPDLTTNDPAKQRQIDSGGLTPDNSTAENHCTIYAVAESPLDEKLIWVGTDDGNLQLTRDGGKTWTNTVGNVPALPPNTWVTGVEASRFDEKTAYATFDGHRTGDMTTYVYKTTDYGASWTSLVTGDIEGYSLVIREDLVRRDLLFLGTEFGLYVSIDGGSSWARFKGNVPKVGVRDIAIHPRDHDLILGTHGRGILILDDITPLRQLTPEVLEAKTALIESRPAAMLIPASIQEFPGDDEFVGGNPLYAASITYYLQKRHMFGDLKLEIYDGSGKLLSSIPGTKRRGLNRVGWSMRSKPPKVPPAASLVPQFFSFLGPRVPEGEYTVRLIRGKETMERKIQVVPDPRATYTAEEKALQDKVVVQLYEMVEDLTFLVDSVIDAREQARDRAGELGEKDRTAVKLEAFADELDAFRKTLVATRKGGFIAGEEQLRERLTALYGSVNSYEGSPSENQIRYMKVLGGQVGAAKQRFGAITAKSVDGLNSLLQKKKLDPIAVLTREAWLAKQN